MYEPYQCWEMRAARRKRRTGGTRDKSQGEIGAYLEGGKIPKMRRALGRGVSAHDIGICP